MTIKYLIDYIVKSMTFFGKFHYELIKKIIHLSDPIKTYKRSLKIFSRTLTPLALIA